MSGCAATLLVNLYTEGTPVWPGMVEMDKSGIMCKQSPPRPCRHQIGPPACQRRCISLSAAQQAFAYEHSHAGQQLQRVHLELTAAQNMSADRALAA